MNCWKYLRTGWVGLVGATCLALAGYSGHSQGAVVYGASGAIATGTTSLSVPYPTGIAAGNLLVLSVGNKYPTNGPATPAGWTLVAQGTGGSGGSGVDSGNVYATVFVKEAVGTESGNLALTLTSADTAMAQMYRYTKTAGASWNYAATTGADTSAGTSWSVTGAANPGIVAGDIVIATSAMNGNRVSNWGESISATGVTFAAATERMDSNSGTGQDMGMVVSEHSVSSGTATAAPVYSMTGSSGSANANSPTGASVMLRIREMAAPTASKSFASKTIAPGGTSVLTITITNPNNAAITGLAFTDTYPSTNLKNAVAATASQCGGTVTGALNGSSLSLSGGSVAANSSCTVSVTVTSSVESAYVNSTGTITSSNAPSASAANALLTVSSLNCFNDDFNRADGAPAGNWVVTNEGGAFGNPAIVSNRLRLTDTTNNNSTMAALQQLFPGAGNKVVVEFDHLAYNGSGADGIAIVLSDASVAPVPGAFGGSLGYAPKQVSLGGDTTHPGFAGGWLGLAIDEFGNFSNNTEGRQGGSAPGATADSIAIRGSGSAYSGYPYHRGTATLSPGIDVAGSTPAPGYRYRITVDHTDGVHAYTSVERNTGAGFSTLISSYDAKAESGQAAVPVNWLLSFTGSTGGATNIHEIDNLQVCSTNAQVVPTLDHVRILHDGSALTCSAEDIQIKACADSTCSTLYTGSVTVDLSTIAGATWSADPITFSGGQTTVTLAKATAGTVTLGGTVTSPSATTTAASCYIGATANCSLTYTLTSACFDVAEVGKNAVTPIYTKLAGTLFSLDVISLSGSSQTPTAVALVDASSGTCGTYTALQASSTANAAIAGNGRKTYDFTYNSAAPNVRVRVTTAGGTACSSDNFAIRPGTFVLSTSSSLSPGSNTPTAGSNFNLTATAKRSNGTTDVASGYTGTPTTDATKVADHNSAAIATGALTGSFSAGGGVSATGATFQYHDVGTITFNADSVVDTSFTAVDQVTGFIGGVDHGSNGDCVASSVSNTLASGLYYGCTVGSGTLGPLGRFKADHFDLTASFTGASCGVGTGNEFTYMDQDALALNLRLLAKSSGGVTLSRYTAGYASAGTLAITGDNGGAAVALSRLSSPALQAVAWSSGAYASSTTLPDTHIFTRTAAPDGPYDAFRIKVVVTDPDGAKVTQLNGAAYVQTNATDPVYSPTTKIRYGRLRFTNAFGSEQLPLSIFAQTEYYNGSGWVLNTLDNCTTLQSLGGAPSLPALNLTTPTGSAATTTPRCNVGTAACTAAAGVACNANTAISGGSLGMCLTASGATGYTDFTFSPPSYLLLSNMINNTGARASFGLHNKGNNRIIYRRERY